MLLLAGKIIGILLTPSIGTCIVVSSDVIGQRRSEGD